MLIVTSVEAERSAVLLGLGLGDEPGRHLVVETVGVGPAAAAAETARLLAISDPFDLVVSAGIAGGFGDRAPVGAMVLGARAVAADLGAESPHGFHSLQELDLGPSVAAAHPAVLAALREARPDAIVGDILTVATTTGTAERASELRRRHPEAVAEAMEGFAVATAATRANAGFVEIRTIANLIGPRDRAAWRIPEALQALSDAIGPLASLVV